jgi:hypothetical protein
MKETLTFKAEYANGEGIFVQVIPKAPKIAKEKADIICMGTVRQNEKKKLKKAIINYYTPDEAMGLAIGLLRAVDVVMDKKFKEFRKDKNSPPFGKL